MICQTNRVNGVCIGSVAELTSESLRRCRTVQHNRL